jgi:hypothetical protein
MNKYFICLMFGSKVNSLYQKRLYVEIKKTNCYNFELFSQNTRFGLAKTATDKLFSIR